MTEQLETSRLDASLAAARERRPAAEAELVEFCAIPSISSSSAHSQDVEAAANWVATKLRGFGMSVEVDSAHGKPVISAEWLGRADAPTLAIYGHYDVQPPDPLAEWLTPPFEPQVRDGFIYARGSSDDKGQLLAGIKAVEYAFEAGGPPVNLRFLIEGEEEISGHALARFLDANRERLHTDHLLIADSGFEAPGLPALLTGLRGLLYTEVEVVGPRVDLHSGRFGGVAPNPFNTLAHILAALKSRDGVVQVPGFYDAVREPDPRELESWRQLPSGEQSYLREIGSPALEGEAGYSVHERLWSRPTLDVHGVMGGFVGEGSKTVIPARATAKVSMRLVPDQDPAAIFSAVSKYVESLATPGTRATVRQLNAAPPVVLGVDHAGIAAAAAAFEAAFGARPVFVRDGGSIPVTSDFQAALNPQIVVTGFGLPDDGLHSPNEHFSLDHYHRATEMVLHLMANLRRQ